MVGGDGKKDNFYRVKTSIMQKTKLEVHSFFFFFISGYLNPWYARREVGQYKRSVKTVQECVYLFKKNQDRFCSILLWHCYYCHYSALGADLGLVPKPALMWGGCEVELLERYHCIWYLGTLLCLAKVLSIENSIMEKRAGTERQYDSL